MKFFTIIAGPAALLATPAFAQAMAPREYVATAGASDLFERQSAQVVLKTTANPDVRMFATMMLKAHSQSTAEVKAAALKSKVAAPPPMLTPSQNKMLSELRTETGAARDTTYIAQQKTAHGAALSVQQAYATDGTAPALKLAAARIVPVVKSHIAMLAKM